VLLRVLQKRDRIAEVALAELARLLPRVILVAIITLEVDRVEDAEFALIGLMLVRPDRQLNGTTAGFVHQVVVEVFRHVGDTPWFVC